MLAGHADAFCALEGALLWGKRARAVPLKTPSVLGGDTMVAEAPVGTAKRLRVFSVHPRGAKGGDGAAGGTGGWLDGAVGGSGGDPGVGASGGDGGGTSGAAGGAAGGGGKHSGAPAAYANVTAGSLPVGVELASAAVLTTPPKGAVRVGAVEKLNPHCTASAPLLTACAPGYMRVSPAAPATALYRTMRGSP